MGLSTTRTVISRGVPIYQGKPVTAAGGFTLDQTGLVLLSILAAGSLIGYNEATRKAQVIKSLSLQTAAGAADTAYKVAKGGIAKVGDVFAYVLKGTAYDITAIDTTDPNFDLVTLSTTLGKALPIGTALFQAAAAVATTSAPLATPKGYLYEDTDVTPNATISVVIDGVVYARRIPGVSADLAALVPNVILSQSY